MEAAGLTPLEPYPGSMKKWRCRCLGCGEEVAPKWAQIQQGGGGCRACADTNLRLDDQEAVASMRSAGFDPLEPYVNNYTPWPSRCLTCNRLVSPRLGSVKQGGGCRHCARDGQRHDVQSAVAIMQSAGLEPLEPYPGAVHKPWKCRCERCGRSVTPRLSGIKRGTGGCKYCGWDDASAAQHLDNELVTEAMTQAGLEPLEPYPGLHRPWKSRCVECSSLVSPHFSTVRHRGSGCKICADQERGQAQRFDTDEALKVMQNAGVEPQEPYPGYFDPWQSQCRTCGKLCSPALSNVRRGQGACRHCAGKWDEADIVAFMRERNFEPLEPYPGAHQPWRVSCTACNAQVQPHFSTVKHGGGCRNCAGQIVTHEQAVERMNAAGFDPLESYVNAVSKWKCRCTTCGETVFPTLDGATSGRGCRNCARSGFNPIAPAVVYLLAHEEWHAAKVGITGAEVQEKRLAAHRRNGWTVVGLWDVDYGGHAETVEDQVLDWWRNELAAPQAIIDDRMPQHGKTETASLVDVSLEETATYIWRCVAQT
jgi:hypothetical protein